jgi:thioredoxin reductase (NADPH)
MNRRADVVIVGGGPAGLAAALYLGRFRHQVVVFDAGDARAKLIPRSHNCPGFPDGISGPDLIRLLRRQACQYGSKIVEERVDSIETAAEDFEIRTAMGSVRSRCVILATGIVDVAPDIPKLHETIASGAVRLCPVCDGYEVIGKRVAVVGPEDKAMQEALFLRDYTPDVFVLPVHPSGISGAVRSPVAGVTILDPVSDLVRRNPGFTVVLENGQTLDLDAIYAAMGSDVRSQLASALGARCDADGQVLVNPHQETSVKGLYAIGDVVKALNQIAVGFGHAALAAADIHNALRDRQNPAGSDGRRGEFT